MIYLLIGALLAALVWLGRQERRAAQREWRIVAGVLATVCLVAAVASALRGAWLPASLLGAASVWMSLRARRPEGAPPPLLNDAQARAILGVDAAAGPEEIQAAYLRLMRTVHPDRGGSTGLAAQLNAARDRLLRRP